MNLNLLQLARDNIDKQLVARGWSIQDKSKINLNAAAGITISKHQNLVGPLEYVRFVNKMNFDEQTEQKMIANGLNDDNRKFIALFGVLNQTLNCSI